MVLQAHHEVIASALAEIKQQIGRTRKGRGGKDGREPRAIAWVSFDITRPSPRLELNGRTSRARGAPSL